MSSSGAKRREGTAEPTNGTARQRAEARALTEEDAGGDDEDEDEEEEEEEEGEEEEEEEEEGEKVELFPGGAGHAARAAGEPRRR